MNSCFDDVFVGKYASYSIKESLGRGGNGKVFRTCAFDSKSEVISNQKEYALKKFNVERRHFDHQRRERRFIKEIKTVLELQNQITGIVPILDHGVLSGNEEDLWYVMPLGSNYKISEDRGFLEILEDFLIIAETVSQLHKTGHFHRDIKPDNLLYVRGKICLTDFGLIGCLNDDLRLTKEHDHIGPYRILPPELLDIVETRTDYRKSDVYLLAKTLWMVLKKNNNGFWGEYNRGKMIGLNASEYGTETLQPLHELMELATKYEYDERIDIEKFKYFLQLQKAIVEGKVSKAELYKFIHNEAVNKHLHLISSDETVYVEKNKIERVLCDCTKNCRICLNSDADEDFGRILQIERTGLDLYTIQTAKFPYFTGTKNYNVFVSEVKVIQDLEQCIVITCRSDSAVPKQAQCCINMTDAMRSPFSEVYLSAEIVLYLKV